MQTFLERLESDNLDPEIDSEYVEYLFDEIEFYAERFPWVPLEEYIEDMVENAISGAFTPYNQHYGIC